MRQEQDLTEAGEGPPPGGPTTGSRQWSGDVTPGLYEVA